MPARDLAQLDWDQIRVFLAVAREGQLARAAARLGLDVSTVSRRLDRLEHELGVHLFDRSREGTTPTAAAEAMVAAAEQMERGLAELATAADAVEQVAEGRVRLTSPPGIADAFVAPALARFHARYPRVAVDLDSVLRVGRADIHAQLEVEHLAVAHEADRLPGQHIDGLGGLRVDLPGDPATRLDPASVEPEAVALRPADQILAVLARMEAGELSARMPRPRLIELRRIAAGFDHLAEQLQKTLASQRQLAMRLLAVREEERRRLARELHDEFGQCLASIGAEAAFIGGRAETRDPELLPAARAIAAVTAHMMESLQGILLQLRPVGLEEFGLSAALEALVGGWRRRQADCVFELKVDGEIDALPDALRTSLYRIVQESLTNALRHGDPGRVKVDVRCDGAGCRLRVDDDGAGREGPTAGSGLGVLGMHERVEALGGRFALMPRMPRGMRVEANFPAEAVRTVEMTHD